MLTVKSLFLDNRDSLGINSIVENRGLDRKIESHRTQKTALGITGLYLYVHSNRVQIFGNSEIAYLNQTSKTEQFLNITKLFQNRTIPCIVLTHNLSFSEVVEELAKQYQIPLITTSFTTEHFIDVITELLFEKFAPETNIHGTLVDVYGIGLLLIGKSGIGKSEIALELIKRGHRFVSDDVVKIRKIGPVNLYGFAPEIIKHYLEIRGLGVLNIKDLFGIVSVRNRKKIELVIELADWDPKENYDRIGLDDQFYTVLELSIPYLKLPLRQGRDIATIVEIAARNQLAKQQGVHSAKTFHERLIAQIEENSLNSEF
ncbi:HPr(Ser) kinase/phosphatase [bacterium]|nr:HPr(Ser) kinase/phosphatase [bacterium]